MTTRTLTMSEDNRPIESIHFADNENSYRVGPIGITKIVYYEEPGQMAGQPWFAIYRGDEIIARVNGAYIDLVRYVKLD